MKNNDELEYSIIGTVINTESIQFLCLQKINKPDVFENPYAQLCYKFIQEMFISQIDIDAFSFKEYLTKKKSFNKIGDDVFKEIISYNLSVPNFDNRLKKLANNYIYRVQIETAKNIMMEAEEGIVPPEELVIKAITSLEETLTLDKSEKTKTIGSQFSLLQKYIKGEIKEEPSLTIGYPELDNHVKMKLGDFVVIAARSSIGKSAFLLEVLRRLSFFHKIPCAVFTLEMNSIAYTKRIVATHNRIYKNALEPEGYLTPDQQSKIDHMANQYATAPLYIEDEPYLDVNALFARIMVLALTKGIKFFAIDLLTLIKLIYASKNQNKADAIADFTAGIKRLARKLNVIICGLHQINRDVDKKLIPRPELADLKDASSIEMDADIIMFLYRHDFYLKNKYEAPPSTATKNNSDLQQYNGKYVIPHWDKNGNISFIDLEGKCELIIAKGRDIGTGRYYFDFNKKFGSFEYNAELSDLINK